MKDTNPVQITVDPQHSLDNNEQITNLTSISSTKNHIVKQAVGSLLYLS